MNMKTKIKKSLKDEKLYKNLKTFASAYKQSKANAYEGLDFEAMKAEMNSLKGLTRKRGEDLFEEFTKNACKNGAKVYRADTGEDACAYIARICKEKGIKSIVKSKSMTSEEIHLNDYLEKEGIKPVETDLGEWILQLAHEHPSHMVMPAIHKTRDQVAELFEKALGGKVDKEDIEAMVKIARKELRSEYFEAGAGLTGANAAVASTGTIGIVTNECNARLSASLPPVHFVLMGYEKLVPDFETALKLIRMLPKSATGQKISTYVTWIKGQNESFKSDNNTKETHYIFLDNGRLPFLEHPILSEALKCMRCGSCANICPAYEMVGGHVFGHVYIGAIGLIMTAMFHGDENAKDILKMCIGCRACSSNCPSGIDLQKIIAELNIYSGKKYGLGFGRKFLYSSVMSRPDLFKNVMGIGRIFAKPLVKDGSIKSIPMAGERNFRELPSIAEKTFTEIYQDRDKTSENTGKKVFFYQGCAVEYFYPQMGVALVELLERKGYQVDVPEKSVCCGLPALHGGDGEGGKKTIEKNLAMMKNPEDYDAYIVLCPSCGFAVKDDFLHHMSENPDMYKKAEKISKKVISLANFLEKEGVKISAESAEKVTYHSPCHQKRGLGTNAEELLKGIFGDNFVPLTDADVCCGFGGSWSVDFPGMSKGILGKKIENIEATGADIVLTDCPGCVIQIKGGIDKYGRKQKVMHLAEMIKGL
ncbi:MAG: FeS-binding protein [Denitrovibrio sp.]|nr:MAG: FeS-binding protein [Denitrovibrio sp.]